MSVIAGCGETESGSKAEGPEETTAVGRPDDLRAFLASGLAAGEKEIVIPPGRYRVQAEQGNHLVFSGLTGVTLVAEGVELVCTSTVRALWFDGCTDVTLRGLTIDYDPLPFTQGRITAMAEDKSWLEFEVAEGYPLHGLGGPFQIYDPSSGSLRRGDGRWNEEIESLGSGRFRVGKARPYRFDPAEDGERIGDILVAKSRHGKPGSPHAVELRGCKGMRLEDVTVHASPSFGFLERHCDGSTYLRCKVDRRAAADDPVRRALPRMRSLNADAFHSKDASRGPAILSCTARFMGDDAVNINGRYHYVRGCSGRELRVIMVDPHARLDVGDPVEFIPYAGPRPPDARIVRKRPDPGALSEQEKAFIRGLRMDGNMRTELLEGRARLFTLTLDREISLAAGSAVCCPLRLGSGFAVKDCDFGENRSRGILIKASNGEVSGNRLTNNRMHAILVSPEFWWMEAGMSSGLMIKDNLISGCLETPIEIHARGGNRAFLPAGALRNISIVGNRIEDSAWPLIHVTSAQGLRIEGNVLPDAPPYAPAVPAPRAILLENCQTR